MSQQDRRIDTDAVLRAYARWAPVYDFSFSPLVNEGRKQAVARINKTQGRVLEVGVGTGVSLPHYGNHLSVSGIDLSPQMLARARKRVARHKLTNIAELREMDATHMDYADESFDTVVAMYVMTVVPNPEQVLCELERICKPGGCVVIVNHFAGTGLRGRVERFLSRHARALGWHADFPIEAITMPCRFPLVERLTLKPLGLFTMLRFLKPDAEVAQAVA